MNRTRSHVARGHVLFGRQSCSRRKSWETARFESIILVRAQGQETIS